MYVSHYLREVSVLEDNVHHFQPWCSKDPPTQVCMQSTSEQIKPLEKFVLHWYYTVFHTRFSVPCQQEWRFEYTYICTKYVNCYNNYHVTMATLLFPCGPLCRCWHSHQHSTGLWQCSSEHRRKLMHVQYEYGVRDTTPYKHHVLATPDMIDIHMYHTVRLPSYNVHQSSSQTSTSYRKLQLHNIITGIHSLYYAYI